MSRSRAPLRLACVVALALAPRAHAVDRAVPGTYGTIGAAVAASLAGDRIVIDPGAYDERVDATGRTLTFTANGAPGSVTWTAPTGSEILFGGTGSNLTVQGIAFDGGTARRGITVGQSTLTVTDSTFIDGYGNITGGGIRAVGCTVTVTGSTFTGNAASGEASGYNYGGGIYVESSDLDVATSTFDNNRVNGTYGEGGAIRGFSSDVVVTDSTFLNGYAGRRGGAISTENGTQTVTGSTFTANYAVNSGGAIRVTSSSVLTVTDSRFEGNTADSYGGGAAYLTGSNGTATFTRNLFCENDAPVGIGGAIGLDAYNSVLRNNVFAGNLSADSGGVVYGESSSSINSRNNTYADNASAVTGGALYGTQTTPVTTVNDMFVGNSGNSYVVYQSCCTYSLTPSYDLWYQNTGTNHNGTANNSVFADPMLPSWPSWTCDWADFIPAAGSPAIDAGSPLILDADGGPSDIGAMGGPDAPLTDDDGDGWYAYEDCDDTNAAINPGAVEVCDPGNLVDEDCNKLVDDDDPGVTGTSLTWADKDADGFGDFFDTPAMTCPGPYRADNGDDCNDANPAVHDGPRWYLDSDGDGLGDAAVSVLACAAPAGYVADDTDCDDTTAAIGGPTTWYRDRDGDGYGMWQNVDDCTQPAGYVAIDGDCDDDDPNAAPDLQEVCDGIDNDCDTLVDDTDPSVDLGTARDWFADTDGDGFGAGPAIPACMPPPGSSELDTDCDDGNAAVNPDATEICNGIDDDCVNGIDVGAADATIWYEDADNDGTGDGTSWIVACSAPGGYVANPDDCDDGDPTRGAPTPWYLDADGDGVGSGAGVVQCAPPPDHVAVDGDCDDAEAQNFPGNPEVCDGLDNDCDGQIDGADPSVDLGTATTWYEDADGDGFGTGAGVAGCTPPAGWVADDTDCDDANDAVHPGASEVCNLADDDCNGIDDDNAIDGTQWYADADGDGYGDDFDRVDACSQPAGYIDVAFDCDDNAPYVNPAAVEVCDGIDNDCNSDADGGAVDADLWYADTDLDGHGDGGNGLMQACSPGPGWSLLDDDCDDADATVFPGAPELCNGIDDDCDLDVDEDMAFVDWYPDADGDGFGDQTASPVNDCDTPDGFVTDATDCDDGSAEIHPGATETADDGIDQDCDGDDLVGESSRDVDTDDPSSETVDPKTASGCGCDATSTSGGVGWLALPLALVALRRRGAR